MSIYYRYSYVELLDQKIESNFTKLFSEVITSHTAKYTCEFFWSTCLTTPCDSVVKVYRHLMLSSYFYWRYMILYIFFLLHIFSFVKCLFKPFDFSIAGLIFFPFLNWRIIALLKDNCFTEFSVKLQHDSAIGIHIFCPFWTSLPSPFPPHTSRLIQSPC